MPATNSQNMNTTTDLPVKKVWIVRYDDDYDVTTYRALVGYLPVSNLLLAAGIDGYQGDNDEDEDNRFAVKAK